MGEEKPNINAKNEGKIVPGQAKKTSEQNGILTSKVELKKAGVNRKGNSEKQEKIVVEKTEKTYAKRNMNRRDHNYQMDASKYLIAAIDSNNWDKVESLIAEGSVTLEEAKRHIKVEAGAEVPKGLEKLIRVDNEKVISAKRSDKRDIQTPSKTYMDALHVGDFKAEYVENYDAKAEKSEDEKEIEEMIKYIAIDPDYTEESSKYELLAAHEEAIKDDVMRIAYDEAVLENEIVDAEEAYKVSLENIEIDAEIEATS